MKRRTEQRELQRVREEANDDPLPPVVITAPGPSSVEEPMETEQNSSALNTDVREGDVPTVTQMDVNPAVSAPSLPALPATSAPVSTQNIQRKIFYLLISSTLNPNVSYV